MKNVFFNRAGYYLQEAININQREKVEDRIIKWIWDFYPKKSKFFIYK